MRLVARLFGVRTVEGPEAVRVTLPRWMVKLMPDVLEQTRGKVIAEYPAAFDVRIVNRSIIAKFR